MSDRFDEACAKAEAHLSDEVTKILEEVSDTQRSIWSAQMTYIGLSAKDAREFFKEGFGSGPQQRIDGLREKVRKLLRPLARGEKGSRPRLAT